MGRPRGQKYPCAVGVRLTVEEVNRLSRWGEELGVSPSACVRLLLRLADREGFPGKLLPLGVVSDKGLELVKG
jgi:hypothetical protein